MRKYLMNDPWNILNWVDSIWTPEAVTTKLTFCKTTKGKMSIPQRFNRFISSKQFHPCFHCNINVVNRFSGAINIWRTTIILKDVLWLDERLQNRHKVCTFEKGAVMNNRQYYCRSNRLYTTVTHYTDYIWNDENKRLYILNIKPMQQGGGMFILTCTR